MGSFADQVIEGPIQGLLDDARCPILCPADAAHSARKGVTEQFLERADQYDRKYYNDEHWGRMLRLALPEGTSPPQLILDLGCGSGNTTFPLLRRYPAAQIVAADISPDLLAILRSRLIEAGEEGRTTLLCLDATRARFQPDRIDLIVGGSILHHLMDPEQVLISLSAALRPGGRMVFIEPFGIGAAMIRMVLLRILDQNSAAKEQLSPAAEELFRRISRDYGTRSTLTMGDPLLAQLDDKWLFSRAFFEGVAGRCGLELNIKSTFLVRRDGPIINESVARRPAARPLAELTDDQLMDLARSRQFEAYIRVLLRMDTGESLLPEWAWGIIEAHDALMPLEVKRDILHEGAVVMRRPYPGVAVDTQPVFSP